MKAVVPAILEKDFKEIKNKLAFLKDRTKTVQIDFCDGIFVPSRTWPFTSGGLEDADFLKIVNEQEGMPYWQDFDFEFDMMTVDAVEKFDIYMKLGPKRIIFHLAAQKNLREFEEFLEGIDPYMRDNLEIGIAVLPDTDLKAIAGLLNKADFVQCMGIDQVGFQGQQFNPIVLEKIKWLKENMSGLEVSVDGSVNMETAGPLIEAGADRLGIGSALWKAPDIIGALEKFESMLQ